MVNEFFFNNKIAARLNYYWKKRGVIANARLKKRFDKEGNVSYYIVSDLVVLPDYTIGVKDERPC